MNEDEQRAAILEFERNRQMLASISAQKQQVAMQLEMINASLEELSKTKEKTVYKVVGNVLFPKDAKEMQAELDTKKESTDLRLKTLEKQEENSVKKLKSIQAKLEAEMKSEKEKAPSADKTTVIEKKKK
jgi:prefoldin beta subunit